MANRDTLEPLKVTPDVWLTFVKPLDQLETLSMQLENTEDRPVVFKVKTTANELLTIKETRGFLEANGVTKVLVTRAADPSADEKKSRRLIVLSI